MRGPGRSTVVLGIGNLTRRDDGVGLHVVRRLCGSDLAERCDLKENPGAWLSALEQMAGYDRAILIDAADVGKPPGTVVEMSPRATEDASPQGGFTLHGRRLGDALRFGRELGLRLPAEVRVLGVQVADVESYSEHCTPEVEQAIGEACELVRRWVLRKET